MAPQAEASAAGKKENMFVLSVEPRLGRGSAEGRRLRAAGKVPVSLYHRHEQPMIGALEVHPFTVLASKARRSQVFELRSPMKEVNGRSAIVRDIQTGFQKGTLLHVDLQLLKDDEEIKVQVAIQVTGESVGVKTNGGILTIARYDVEVFCLPKNIPDQIVIDVTHLDLGQSIHAADLKLPSGVRYAGRLDETIVSVVEPKVVEETTTAAAAAPADGAAPAEGAAPAAEGGAAAPAAAAAAPAKGAPAKGK